MTDETRVLAEAHDHGGRPCPECGHSDRMHVVGASPRYAGCMERVPRKHDDRLVRCWCALTPDAVRAALSDGGPIKVTHQCGDCGAIWSSNETHTCTLRDGGES